MTSPWRRRSRSRFRSGGIPRDMRWVAAMEIRAPLLAGSRSSPFEGRRYLPSHPSVGSTARRHFWTSNVVRPGRWRTTPGTRRAFASIPVAGASTRYAASAHTLASRGSALPARSNTSAAPPRSAGDAGSTISRAKLTPDW